jgi:hypothetical protein
MTSLGGTVTNWLLERTGWVAYVEPVGKTWIEPSGSCRSGRAEAVYVTAISVWCMQVLVDAYRPFGPIHGKHSVDAGLLYKRPFSTLIPTMLLPVCGAEEIDVEATPLRFHVRDGHVFFSRKDR